MTTVSLTLLAILLGLAVGGALLALVLESQRLHQRRSTAELARLAEQLRDERARSQMLTNTIIDMKLSGGSVQRLRPLPAGERLPQRDRTDIEAAIAQNKHARRIPGLAAHLAKWADEVLLDPNADRKRVLDRLRTWSTVSEDDDDDDEEDDLEDGVIDLGDGDVPADRTRHVGGADR